MPVKYEAEELIGMKFCLFSGKRLKSIVKKKK